MDMENGNGVNFKSVLHDLAKGLHKIGYQKVLNNVIQLLQLKGDEAIIDLLKDHINNEETLVALVDVYMHFEDREIINSPYSQYILKV